MKSLFGSQEVFLSANKTHLARSTWMVDGCQRANTFSLVMITQKRVGRRKEKGKEGGKGEGGRQREKDMQQQQQPFSSLLHEME